MHDSEKDKGYLVEVDHFKDGIGELLDTTAVVLLDKAEQGERK
jgi:hypothetical protein